jgi:hypothetical protein
VAPQFLHYQPWLGFEVAGLRTSPEYSQFLGKRIGWWSFQVTGSVLLNSFGGSLEASQEAARSGMLLDMHAEIERSIPVASMMDWTD